MEKELLRLFKGYLGEKSDKFNESALKYGLLIPDTASETVVNDAIELYGKDGSKWNQSFHKDFEIVANAPIEDLIAQQLIHYITTYGFEVLGLENGLVYIPKEKLEIPELKEDIEMISILPLTEEEITEKIMSMLTSGIALSKQTISDIMVLSDYIDKDKFDEIKNKEIRTNLYRKYNIMPRNPEEFLRYLIFELTGNSLKIQSKEAIHSLSTSNKLNTLNLLKAYLEKTPNGEEKLSSIFLRNKALFLALKMKNDIFLPKKEENIQKELNAIINKLRRLAVKNHKPLKKGILDTLTDISFADYSKEELIKELDKTTIFRELRILNGIKYKLEGSANIVYRVRNGKSYVSTLKDRTDKVIDYLTDNYKTVYDHLINRLSESVKDKTIFIPKNVVYAVPTSEKQFFGNIPQGSYLEVPRDKDIVYGIYWKNLEAKEVKKGFYGEDNDYSEERVDLDLKQMNKDEVFGWDASYRNLDNILFSGDMTDAKRPTGASELFYVKKSYGQGAFLVTVNAFTSHKEEVPYEFVIANANRDFKQRVHYALDPNDILTKVDMSFEPGERQKTLGLISIGDSIKFYFNNFAVGVQGCTSRRDSITMGAFDYLREYGNIQLKLNDLLVAAGAKLVDSPVLTEEITNEEGVKETVEKAVDVNLSLETITKETLISLLS